MHLIYALRDPRDGEIRYLGSTSRGLERPLEHRPGPSARGRWLAELWAAGLRPDVLVVQRFRGRNARRRMRRRETVLIRQLRGVLHLTNTRSAA